MSKWSCLLGVVAILLAPSIVLASPSSIPVPRHDPQGPEPDAQETGIVASIDQEIRSVTLADGHRFKIPAWISFDRLAKGVLISIIYTPNPHHTVMDVKTITII